MTVRPATTADADRLVEMSVRFAEAHYSAIGPPDRDKLRGLVNILIQAEGFAAFVAERDGQVFGMIGAQVYDHPMLTARVATEVAWWLEPEARGGMTGIRLLTAIEHWGRAQGATILQVASRHDDERVGRLYAARGYRHFEDAFMRSA